jgi:ribonucleoside-diphosphate reductase alpha chain
MKKFYWLNDDTRKFLSKGILVDRTPEQRLKEIAHTAEQYLGITGYAEKFFDYMSRGFFSLSSPVWPNYGTKRGFPVSCFGGVVPDSMDGIQYTLYEQAMLTKGGGGTSAYFGNVRPRGSDITDNGKTEGSINFMKQFNTMTDVVSQGQTRRGYMAAYLPLEHGDIEEFLEIGSDGNAIQNLMTGVTVTDEWLQSMIDGDNDKRKVWAKVLKSRSTHGYPYIMFSDNANNNKPECYKDKPILASNLCSEIMLPSNEDESFVCVLCSMNLLHYDEWKDTDAVETLVFFMDTMVTDFLHKLEEVGASEKRSPYNRVYSFAKNHRALGLGVLGWHSYLQSKMIAFESKEAAKLNLEIFKGLKSQAYQASEKLGSIYGTVMGTNRRNTTLLAVAPTKSSSFVLGQVSQGIEPFMSNYFVNNTAKLISVYKNPYLEEELQRYGMDNEATWEFIRKADGSVQHLDFLSDEVKQVFKTFAEINPDVVIDQAGVRQQYIDQGQSVNLMVSPSLSTKEVNALHIRAWKMGLKALYYQFSLSAAQEMARGLTQNKECVACHA